jgi:hypothetical protein
MDTDSKKRKAAPDDRDKGGDNKRSRVSFFWLCDREGFRTIMSWLPVYPFSLCSYSKPHILTRKIGKKAMGCAPQRRGGLSGDPTWRHRHMGHMRYEKRSEDRVRPAGPVSRGRSPFPQCSDGINELGTPFSDRVTVCNQSVW